MVPAHLSTPAHSAPSYKELQATNNVTFQQLLRDKLINCKQKFLSSAVKFFCCKQDTMWYVTCEANFTSDISHCTVLRVHQLQVLLLYWVDREHPCRRVSRCIVFIAHNSINHRSNIMAIYYAKWQRKHKMKYISTNIRQTVHTPV